MSRVLSPQRDAGHSRATGHAEVRTLEASQRRTSRAVRQRSANASLQVVYIIGCGRSGSTLLDRILGLMDDATSCGELHKLWPSGLVKNQLCSCGKAFDECGFWQAIFGDLIEDGWSREEILSLHAAVDRPSTVFKMVTGCYGAAFREQLSKYRRLLRDLYTAIARRSDASVVVDSSKVAIRAMLLSGIPEIDLHLIHLIRDPRAAVDSRMNSKHNPATGRAVPTPSLFRAACIWIVRNIVCEWFCAKVQSTRLRYEDLTSRPRASTQRLLDVLPPFAGASAPFETETAIRLRPFHSMGGNPDRFECALTEVRTDKKWLVRQSTGRRLLLTVMTLPFLLRYGYSVLVKRPYPP